jgi:hypothetical protein
MPLVRLLLIEGCTIEGTATMPSIIRTSRSRRKGDMKKFSVAIALASCRSRSWRLAAWLLLAVSFGAGPALGQTGGQSLFTTQAPVQPNVTDGRPYELGMKFRLARAGQITAIRYWKASSDTGTHVGRIWSSTGQQLASVTFSGESTSGWQVQALLAPLDVLGNTTYVVTVNIASRYAYTNAGLATQIVNGDISSVVGNNGVYGNSGSFPTNSFQNSNYFRDIVFVAAQAGPATKLVLTPATASTQTNTARAYTATIQDAGGNTVTTATNPVTFTVNGLSGSFSPTSPVTPSNGVATTSFTPTAAGTATITASAQGLTSASATLTVTGAQTGIPSKLALAPANANVLVGSAQTYTASIQDVNGNTVTSATNPVSFSVSGVGGSFNPTSPVTPTNGTATTAFTPSSAGSGQITASAQGLTSATAAVNVAPSGGGQTLFTTQIPAQSDVTDNKAYELGMKFRVSKPGRIVALRYWKAPSDTGTHVGRVWAADGTLLATVTFTSESSSGWQQQALATPLVVAADTTYVVSANVARYFVTTRQGLATSVSNGDIRSVADGLNGVFGNSGVFPTSSSQSSNYFRDIVFIADQVSTVSKVSGDSQAGSPGAALPDPLVVQVNDGSGSPLANVNVTFAVTGGGGSVSPTTATTSANGRASTNLTLGQTGTTTVSATAQGVTGSVTFTGVVGNAISGENLKQGSTGWRITNAVTQTAPEIAGYASATSVNKGQQLPFKITLAQAGQYTIDVYRLGHYGGTGGRLMGSFGPFAGVIQPPCNITNSATLLTECQWTTSFTLQTGADWTSGLYVAKLTAQSSGRQTYIWFVVRDDDSHADLVFQSAFTTYLAYNNYGDQERHSLYGFNSTNGQAAQKVSFDRPFGAVTVDQSRYDKLTYYEHNMVRWLESQGYDVTYVTNMDVQVNPSLLLEHKAYLSVGHDEYWSLEMRDAVEDARDAGINLGFFSANTAFWRVRFEPSSAGSVADRVMACYKDPRAADPVAPTYMWRGPENNRPENALMGVMYVGDDVYQRQGGYDLVVKNTTDPYFANTTLSNGTALSQLVGYEWDAVVNNGFTPNGLVILSESPTVAKTVAPGLPAGTNSSISHSVRYTAASGAKVFSSGSIQYVWGLNSDLVNPVRADPRLKQFVINVLSSMGAKPLTPDTGMIVP